MKINKAKDTEEACTYVSHTHMTARNAEFWILFYGTNLLLNKNNSNMTLVRVVREMGKPVELRLCGRVWCRRGVRRWRSWTSRATTACQTSRWGCWHSLTHPHTLSLTHSLMVTLVMRRSAVAVSEVPSSSRSIDSCMRVSALDVNVSIVPSPATAANFSWVDMRLLIA